MLALGDEVGHWLAGPSRDTVHAAGRWRSSFRRTRTSHHLNVLTIEDRVMMSFRSLSCGLLSLALLATPAFAQSADSSSTGVASPAPAAAPIASEALRGHAQDAGHAASTAGPSREAATAGIRAVPESATTLSAAPARQQGSFGRSETLMIVGGAAFVAGLIIGDDAGTVVMVTGAAIGLYGLYLYLQTH
jgi:hypothetical protein